MNFYQDHHESPSVDKYNDGIRKGILRNRNRLTNDHTFKLKWRVISIDRYEEVSWRTLTPLEKVKWNFYQD